MQLLSSLWGEFQAKQILTDRITLEENSNNRHQLDWGTVSRGKWCKPIDLSHWKLD